MQSRIIDTEKKSAASVVHEFGINLCIGFTVLMVICMLMAMVFAPDEAKQGIIYCWEILGAMFVAALLQLVFFTPVIIKRLGYGFRVLAFGVCFFAVLAVLAAAFGWFPTDNLWAWVSFAITYMVVLVLMSLVFTLVHRRKITRLNDDLKKFKTEKESRNQ